MAKFPVDFNLRAVDRVSKVLNRVKKNFGGLKKSIDRARNSFVIMQKRTEALRNSLNKMGSRLNKVGKNLTTKLTAPLGLAGVGIVKTAVDFEKSMNRVGAVSRTIVNGQVSPQFKALEEKARELGSTTAFSATQVADAMGFLAQAGFKADDILDAIGPTLNLAAAANLDLAQTADIASNIMGAFGIEAKEMSKVADVLALTTATSNVNMEQLGESMKDAAPIAKKFGLSLQETAALTGLLGNIGIQGSKAGTTLKAMMTKLVAPSTKAKKILAKMGVSIKDEATGNIKSMSQILKEIAPQLASLPKDAQLAAINELFGLRGIAGASELLAQSMKNGQNPIEAFTQTLTNSKGASQDMANTLMRGAPGAFKRFQSALEGMAIAIAKSGLLDFIADLAEFFAGLFEKIGKLSPTMLKFISIIGGLLVILGPLLVIAGFIASAISSLITLFIVLSAAGVTLGGVIAFLFSPVTLIIAGIAALIAVGVLLMDNWDAIWAKTVEVWNGIFNFLGGIVDGIIGFFSNMIDFILDGLVLLGKKMLDFFTGGLFSKVAGFFGFDFGEEKGAEKNIASVSEKRQVNDARVDVNFRNPPPGTRVEASGPAPLSVNMGAAGGL